MITKADFIAIPARYAEIERDRKRVAAMRARLYSPKGLDTREKVQSSGHDSMLADTVIDMQQKVDEKAEAFNEVIAEAEQLIYEHLTGDLLFIMRLRYVDVLSWEDISKVSLYSPATLYRYRREAIAILFK